MGERVREVKFHLSFLFVQACAHRYKLVSTAEISGLGKCFLRKADLSPDEISGEWLPCKNKGTGKKAYGYCQAGTGLHITDPEVSDSNF